MGRRNGCDELGGRLLQIRDELLAGRATKEIAWRLRLSRHTIHHYMHAVYVHYGVSGQPELMARLRSAATEARHGGGGRRAR